MINRTNNIPTLEKEENSMNKKKHPREQFSSEEDLKLAQLVKEYGEDDWEYIASYMPNRNVRQCKERWLFYLSPSINKKEFTLDDDLKLIKLYAEMGPKWKTIAKSFQGRTHISIRNRMKQLQRRMMRTNTNNMYVYLLGKNNHIVCSLNGSVSILPSFKSRKFTQIKAKMNENVVTKKNESVEPFAEFNKLFEDPFEGDEFNYFDLENDEVVFN